MAFEPVRGAEDKEMRLWSQGPAGAVQGVISTVVSAGRLTPKPVLFHEAASGPFTLQMASE